MGIVKQINKKSPPKSLAASASLLGLAAGAVGWSGLAQAASEETTSQMMLLPEHYELMENGVVVFKLETGENLSLNADQYLILEDGLLLITDELAQASIYSLPVMGSVRAQLLSDLEQVATIDGTVAEATPAQTLSITEGQAPRLSEQVELQSYQVAQASDEASSETEEALAIGMSVAPGAMALLGMLMTSDQPSSNASPVIEVSGFDTNAGFDYTSAGFDTEIPGQTDIPSDGFNTALTNADDDLFMMTFFVFPFAVATDEDGDALDWSVSLSSDDYTGYGDNFDSASELSPLVDIFWNDEGEAMVDITEAFSSFAADESELAAKVEEDTWTYTVTVSDGNGGTDSASIVIEWPELEVLPLP
jgi:hypothetical protein